MMKSSRGNRLSNAWRCPFCAVHIDTRNFQLSSANPAMLLCPNKFCAREFAWRAQNRGKLWPEQRAYNVLR